MGYNKYARNHLIELAVENVRRAALTCQRCECVAPPGSSYCPMCGFDLIPHRDECIEAINALSQKLEGMPTLSNGMTEGHVFPTSGIYIYYHPYEKYKIGKGEKIVQRRIPTHQTSAPSLELLHVIETSDLDWCEKFLHERFRHRRIWSNHEYFDLAPEDLLWLFAIKVLEPPRNEVTQHSLLDLL